MRGICPDGDKLLNQLFSYVCLKTDRSAYRLPWHGFIVCFLLLIATSCAAPNVSESTVPSEPDSALTATSNASNAETPSSDPETVVATPSKDTDTSTVSPEDHLNLPQENSQESGNASQLSEESRQRLIEAIAAELSQPIETLEIESVTPQTWPNGCLGLAAPDEFCTMALVEGWQVNVKTNGTLAIYRSNANGTIVRRDH